MATYFGEMDRDTLTAAIEAGEQAAKTAMYGDESWPAIIRLVIEGAAPVIAAAVVAATQEAAFTEAANEAHAEAEAQTKLRDGARTPDFSSMYGYSVRRLGVLEQILTDRARSFSPEVATNMANFEARVRAGERQRIAGELSSLLAEIRGLTFADEVESEVAEYARRLAAGSAVPTTTTPPEEVA